ncbi:low molecular weight protein arginine phosphatase [Gracilibacillus dipsosauri]|uniref:low molecular weight protein arginine phosphatase n=1 Tax=Gracilibacillus dipsosauri TaxID=178340 RepID=UPI002409A7A1
MKILFVCTGNTCRSPMAEAILKDISNYEVKSAGLMAIDGYPASPETIQVLNEKGIMHQHQSSQITSELLDWADLVLTMTVVHRDSLKQQFPEHAPSIFTLKEYVDPEIEVAWKKLTKAYASLEEAKCQKDTAKQKELIDEINSWEKKMQDLDISDPFGSNVTTYKKTYDELAIYLAKLVKKLQNSSS